MSRINLDIEDADGTSSIVPIEFEGGFTGDIHGLVETAWGIINPLVNGHLKGASITLTVDISDLTNVAAAAIADVQEGAKFVFRALNPLFKKTITLPTFIETFFTGAGANKEVDLTNSSVIAFVTAMEDGFDDGGGTPVEINPTTNHGEDLVSLEKAHQSWGKER
jgi:hypothetical protein